MSQTHSTHGDRWYCDMDRIEGTPRKEQLAAPEAGAGARGGAGADEVAAAAETILTLTVTSKLQPSEGGKGRGV